MIKHIVMWKLNDSLSKTEKEQAVLKMKTMLENLPASIPQVRSLEVGININTSNAAYDAVLYSEFESMDDLSLYQKHPDHLHAADYIHSVVAARVVADYTSSR